MSAPIIYYAKKNLDLIHLIENTNIQQLEEYLTNCCQHQALFKDANIPYIKISPVSEDKNKERLVRSAVFSIFGNKYLEKHEHYTELLVNEHLVNEVKLHYVKLQKSYTEVAAMIKSHGIYEEKPSLYFRNLKERLHIWYTEEHLKSKAEIDQLLRNYTEYLLHDDSFGSPVFININTQDCLDYFAYPGAGLDPMERKTPTARDAYKLKANVVNNFNKREKNNIILLNSVVGSYEF